MLLRLCENSVTEVLVVKNINNQMYCQSASQARTCIGRKKEGTFHTEIRNRVEFGLRFSNGDKLDDSVGIFEFIMVPESKRRFSIASNAGFTEIIVSDLNMIYNLMTTACSINREKNVEWPGWDQKTGSNLVAVWRKSVL